MLTQAFRVESNRKKNTVERPFVTGIKPSEGSAAGGQEVWVWGGRMLDKSNMRVRFGDTFAAIGRVDGNILECVVPAARAGLEQDTEVAVQVGNIHPQHGVMWAAQPLAFTYRVGVSSSSSSSSSASASPPLPLQQQQQAVALVAPTSTTTTAASAVVGMAEASKQLQRLTAALELSQQQLRQTKADMPPQSPPLPPATTTAGAGAARARAVPTTPPLSALAASMTVAPSLLALASPPTTTTATTTFQESGHHRHHHQQQQL